MPKRTRTTKQADKSADRILQESGQGDPYGLHCPAHPTQPHERAKTPVLLPPDEALAAIEKALPFDGGRNYPQLWPRRTVTVTRKDDF